MDASALYRAVRAAQTATPPPPTPRTLRPRKPLACGCGRVVPQAKIDEAKRLGVGLRCAACGARRPRFKGGALPAPKVAAPALTSASYDHAACMIAWLAR
jgi:hypothetical protein